ncbi:MAG: hypothetical protein GY830_11040 [Bacteroidetes bacterium]|nr:hypothetical protein [Bacteroidota bacterium]
MSKPFWNFLKNTFFPIKKTETSKILAICFLKTFISSIYAILYNIKDALIISAKGSGAEAIPVLKGFLVLPISILFVYIYSSMNNYFKKTTIFYSIMFFFAISFLLYSFIFRPNESYLIPIKSTKTILSFIGSKNSHWVAVYRNWIHSFFYLVAELWTQACIFILFWEFVNRICTIEEAKKSYNLFIASGSLSYALSSFLLYYFIKLKYISLNSKIQILMIVAAIQIGLIMLVYYFLNKKGSIKKSVDEKTKLSFLEGIKFIVKSKYLISIAITVISVGLTINLVEITWKANLKLLYPEKTDLMAFMSKVSGIQNLCSLFVVLLISGNTLKRFSWKFNARVTPIIIMITGVIFFLASKYKNILSDFSFVLGISTLKLVVILGAFQVISSKICKYCFYDITKEIAYIPLDNEAKIKGKAAIDAVGSRLGKSGSSYIHVLVLWLASTSSVLNVTIFLIPILILICFFWLVSIEFISKKLNNNLINSKDIST